MRRRQLLFATYDDERLDEGFAYAVDLAKTLDKNLCVLLVNEKKISERIEDIMAAVGFAEESGADTAREMTSGGLRKADKDRESALGPLYNKSRMAGVEVEVFVSDAKMVSAINEFIKKDPAVDMVLLGPTVTASKNVSAKELKKLVTSVSRPVVTMARHAYES